MCVCGGEAESREQRGEERTPDRAPPTSGFSRFLLRAPLSFLATRPAAPVTRPGRPAHSQPSWPGQALAKPQPAAPAPIRLTTCPLFRKHNRLSPASPVPAVGRPPAPAPRAAPQVRMGRARGVLFTSPRQPRVDCPVPLPGKRGWLVRARGACGAAETGHTLPRGGPVARPPLPSLSWPRAPLSPPAAPPALRTHVHSYPLSAIPHSLAAPRPRRPRSPRPPPPRPPPPRPQPRRRRHRPLRPIPGRPTLTLAATWPPARRPSMPPWTRPCRPSTRRR